LAEQLNAIIAENDGSVTMGDLARLFPMMPHRAAGWFNKTAHKFFFELTDFLQLDAGNFETDALIAPVKAYSTQFFQDRAADVARFTCEAMYPIPADVKIDSMWLGGLTNEQFVQAFSDLQGILIGAYFDIEQDAFAWGFPSAFDKEQLAARVSDVLVSLGVASTLDNHVLIVEGRYFNPMIKNRKKIPLVIAGLESLGLAFEGYSAKSETFRVSYPDNPYVMDVLKTYGRRYEQHFCRRCAGCERKEGACPRQSMLRSHLFSYRHFEDAATQAYETEFLIEADTLGDEARDIVLWLRENASSYGLQLNPHRISCGQLISFKDIKSKKCCDRDKCVLFGNKNDEYSDKHVALTVKLNKVFDAEPQKVKALVKRFPQAFASFDDPDSTETCCHNRECGGRLYYKIDGKQRYRCGRSFVFKNPTLDDVKAVLALTVLERNLPEIKPKIEDIIQEKLSIKQQQQVLGLVTYTQTLKRSLSSAGRNRWSAQYKGKRLFTMSVRNGEWFLRPEIKFDDAFFAYIEREGLQSALWDNMCRCYGCDCGRENCSNMVTLTVLGKVLDNVCNNKIIFHNPGAEALAFFKAVMFYRMETLRTGDEKWIWWENSESNSKK